MVVVVVVDTWAYQQNSIQRGDKIWLKRHVVQSVILWNLPSHEVNLEPTFGDRDRAWIWQGVGSNFQTLSNTKHFHKTQGMDLARGRVKLSNTFKHKTLLQNTKHKAWARRRVKLSNTTHFHKAQKTRHGFGKGQTFKHFQTQNTFTKHKAWI